MSFSPRKNCKALFQKEIFILQKSSLIYFDKEVKFKRELFVVKQIDLLFFRLNSL